MSDSEKDTVVKQGCLFNRKEREKKAKEILPNKTKGGLKEGDDTITNQKEEKGELYSHQDSQEIM